MAGRQDKGAQRPVKPAAQIVGVDLSSAAAILASPASAPAIPPVHFEPAAAPAPVVPPVLAATIAPPAAVPAELAAKEHTMDTTTIDQTAQTAATATDAASDRAQAMFGDVAARTQGTMEKGKKLIEEMGSFNKDNIEAIVESSKIAAKGLETMGQDAAAYAKTSFEGVSEAVRTLATVKSPTEFMKLQSDYARSAFDAMVAQTSRSTEAVLKLAGEVAQPISNRFAVAADKMKIAA